MTQLQRQPGDVLSANAPFDNALLDGAPCRTLSPQFLHDLRTPLNQIIGYSDMLVEQAEEEGQVGFVADLRKIHTAGQQLLALLHNDAPALQSLTEHSVATEHSVPQTPTWRAASMPHTAQPERLAEAQTEAAQSLILVADDVEPNLLVVDDIEANRDVLSRLLERQGYGVDMVSNGRLAMEAVRAHAFDLILLDIMMPEMDGYTVLQQLKADEALRHIPVIMISALDELESVVRCIEMGAEDYLSKPFNPTLLKARIGACLEKKRARDREMRLFEQVQQNYKRLQELEKLRDDLTHMIVHDLRTPMNSVIMGMQTLSMAGDLNEVQREIMSITLSGGETLLGMIAELLDVEKMESGSMDLDYATLCADDLVAAAIGQIALLVESKNLMLIRQIAPGLPPFQGDENKLIRTLVNLLGNAIKFTSSGGTVIVAARESDDRQSLVFCVSDTGEGIPPEAFERIFEKFGQVESRHGGHKMSTGLGLAFCKLAVEAHGGHIGVESAPDQGSAFCFTIPVPSPSQ